MEKFTQILHALTSPLTPEMIANRRLTAEIEARYGLIRVGILPAMVLMIALFADWGVALVWAVLGLCYEAANRWASLRLLATPSIDTARSNLLSGLATASWWAVGAAILWVYGDGVAHNAALAALLGIAIYAFTVAHHDRRLLIGCLTAPIAFLLVLPLRDVPPNDLPLLLVTLAYNVGVTCLLLLTASVTHRTHADLRAAREKAQANAERFTFAVRASGGVVWELDLEERRLIAGEDLRELFGDELTFESVVSKEMTRVHPDDRDAMKRMVADMESSGDSRSLEYRIVLPGGAIRWLKTSGLARRNAEGRVVGVILLSENITARMQAAQSLLATQKELQSFVNRMALAHDVNKSAVFEMDHAQRRIVGGEGLDTLLRRPIKYHHLASEEGIREIVHPDDVARVLARVRQGLKTQVQGSPLEFRIVFADGARWFHMVGVHQRDATGAVMHTTQFIAEIHEKKLHDIELEATRAARDVAAARMEFALGAALATVFELDIEREQLLADESLARLFGGRAPKFADFATLDGSMALIDPRDHHVIEATASALIDPTCDRTSQEYRITWPEMAGRWLRADIRIARNDAGLPRRMVYFAIDITESKTKELEVRAARERAEAEARRTKLVMESHDAIIWEVDFQTGALRGAEDVERFLGRSVAISQREDCFAYFVHPDDMAFVRAELEANIDAGQTFCVEHRLPETRGPTRWVENRGSVVFNPQGKVASLLVMTTDITVRKQRAVAFLELMRNAEQGMAARRPMLLAEASQAGVDAGVLNPQIDVGDAISSDSMEELFVRLARMTGEIETRERALIETVNALKQSRKESERLALIASQGSDAVVITDAEGRIEWVNHAFEAMTEYSLAEIISQKPGAMLQGANTDRKVVEKIALALRACQPVVAELLNYAKSGREYWLDLSITPVFNAEGALQHFIAVERDVTARKRMEENLASALHESRAARESAEAANAEKSRFLANMSHELRTPLNAVIGYAEILEEELTEAGQNASVKDVTRIKTAGRHLLHLINDVLDLSKIEAGKMDVTIETFSVDALVREVADTVAPAIANNGNRLDVVFDDGLGVGSSDAAKIKQCLLNLLSNAAKFTSDGVVSLHARRERGERGDVLRFDVGDSGIGMTPEQVARLFSPFAQADASIAKRFGGTGLGLSLTRSLARLLGGDVDVTSEAGVGSVFTLRVLAEVSVEDAHGDVDALYEDAPVIVVIEDQAAARDLIVRSISRLGYSIRSAEYGRSGLQLVREVKPICVLLDINLPDMSGWDVLRAIKRDPDLADTPVIVCSIEDDCAKAFSLGAVEHLVKPIDRARLAGCVERHAKTHQWPKPEPAMLEDV
jgi:PAS domain S-box-containing protein